MGWTQSLIWFIEKAKAFHKSYLYAKKLDEPLYQHLIDEWKNRSRKQEQTLIKYSEDFEQVVSLDEIDESIQNLIIFDDIIVEKNLNILKSFSYVVVRVIALSYLYTNQILQSLKLFVKFLTTFF